MRSGNPLFSSISSNYDEISVNQASYKGVTLKTLFFLGITGIVAVLSGIMLFQITNFTLFYILLGISSIVGMISVIVGRVSVTASKYCGILYSFCEGLFIGTITALFESIYPGIAFTAVVTTIVIFLVCLVLFACGAIRNASLLSSIGLVFVIGLLCITLIMSLCMVFKIPGLTSFIQNNTKLFLLVEVLFLIYGAISLSLNFHEVSIYVKSGCDKEYEWTAAFGLLITILYIYLQVLRILLYIFARRD